MGPDKRTYWLPLTRLAAFFVVVVIAINVGFDLLRPPAASVVPGSQQPDDRYSRRHKRFERRFYRALNWLYPVPASANSGGEDWIPLAGAALPGLRAADSKAELPSVPEPLASESSMREDAADTDTCSVPPSLVAAPEDGRSAPPGAPEFEAEPYLWPEPFDLSRRPRSLEHGLLSAIDWAEFRAGLVAEFYRRAGADLWSDLGDSILGGPEMLADGFLSFVGGMSGRPDLRTSEDDENRSVAARMLDIPPDSRQQRISGAFLQQWTESEMKYLAAFQDSRMNTFGFENRTEGADLDQFAIDQRKVFWDALRRTYLGRYKVRSEEQIRDGAWYIDRWSGVDFAVLPPFVGAYLYYRGFERKIRMGTTALGFSVEPLSDLIRRNHDLPTAAAIEWTVQGVPLGIILTTGIYDGRFSLDFAGVGTSIGAARGAVEGEWDARRR